MESTDLEPGRNWDVVFLGPDGTPLVLDRLSDAGRLDVLGRSGEPPRPPWAGTDMPVLWTGDLLHVVPSCGPDAYLRVVNVAIGETPPTAPATSPTFRMWVYTAEASPDDLASPPPPRTSAPRWHRAPKGEPPPGSRTSRAWGGPPPTLRHRVGQTRLGRATHQAHASR
jgi:hypothetical protein